ncbi:MAG: phosphotransferase, partial [Candidatus Aminicenantes bacterium]|nr:phosphotransferase [Candidatus Aminicenantes bacterium]
ASSLPSERDQNFLLIENSSKAHYVLKIANQKEKKEVLELQNAAMQRIGSCLNPSLCPQVCLTKHGRSIERICLRNQTSHLIRMVTYVQGQPLTQVSCQTPDLLCSVGEFMARIDQALFGFEHAAAKREFHWDLQKGPETVNRLIKHFNTQNQVKLVQYFLDKYLTQISDVLPGLRKSIIHNDGNDHNILVGFSPDPQHSRGLKVSGIIDFGDMVHSYTVGDIAVAAAYAMLDKKDFMQAVSYVVNGYQKIMALSDNELKALPHLIYMRLCMSVSICAYQKKQNPDNEYLVVTENKAWDLLRRIQKTYKSWTSFLRR